MIKEVPYVFSVIRSLLSGQQVDALGVLAQVISIVFVILCILPLHEFAHGWVANKLGDPTAKLEGRLTFNPLPVWILRGAPGADLVWFLAGQTSAGRQPVF